jgi:hypothetical protein
MMEEMEKKDQGTTREEIFSKTVRAGKRTYFFDVKATKTDEQYLTITESKKKFSNDQGKYFFEKHKIFLYKEDFEKFVEGLNIAIEYIHTGIIPESHPAEPLNESPVEHVTDIEFDKLGEMSLTDDRESGIKEQV